MLPLLRPAPLLLLGSYLLISATPFFALLLGKPVEKPALLLASEAIAWLALWTVFKRPRWFHLLLLPAFLALPVEIYLRIYFGQGISTHHLGIIVETSPKEALEFLGHKVWLLAAVLLVLTGWWWSLYRLARRAQVLDWRHRSRWLALVLLAAGLGLWLYGQEFGIAASKPASAPAASPASAAAPAGAASPPGLGARLHRYVANTFGKLPHWASIPYDEEVFGRTWPLGLAVHIADFWNERSYLAKLAEKSSKFRFQAHQESDRPQTVVVVIGESSRYDRWGINGYARDTNPLLKREANLVSFSDMVTAVAATRLAVPVIVSRKPATQSLKAGFAEKSFLTAYKEAGFKTFWLSNQMSFGQFDTPISVFAKEADVTQFLNLGGFTNNSNLDAVLLEPLGLALNDAAPKKLIVLHTLGNHWNYSHRHPKEYDKWQPSLFGVNNPAYTDLKNKTALSNSYDNSILYTDWVLEQMIQKLKGGSGADALLYVSDHGQTLYDGSCNLAFHGHNTQFEFHIPAFIWYSDRYAAQFPDKVATLRRHRHARLSTENIFHTVLDLGDIRYPDERLEWSILSTRLLPHTRYVDSYGWSNYDNATLKGDCREIIDKKKPLAQEK